MNVSPMLLLFVLAAPAMAQVTIDSHGVRTGDTTIDATGVHTRGGTVDASGVRGARPRSNGGALGRLIDGNHITQRVDCRGGALTVEGNHNNLTVANCRAVTVAGNHNIVNARFDMSGRLAVEGNYNQATYSAAPRASVSVSNDGNRSTVTRR